MMIDWYLTYLVFYFLIPLLWCTVTLTSSIQMLPVTFWQKWWPFCFCRLSYQCDVPQPRRHTVENNPSWSRGWSQQPWDSCLWIWHPNTPGQSKSRPVCVISIQICSGAFLSCTTQPISIFKDVQPLGENVFIVRASALLNTHRMWWHIIWTWPMLMRSANAGRRSIASQRASEYQTPPRPPCIMLWSASPATTATYRNTMSSTLSAMTWQSVTVTAVLTTCVQPER